MIKKVALKKTEIKDKKYKISLKSIIPLPTLEKCVIGLSSCNNVAKELGKVTATMSKPTIISPILKVRPIIKATIWFLVRLDVNNPIDTSDPAKNIEAKYWAKTAPQSKLPAEIIDMGMLSVARIEIETNINPAINFAIKMTQPRIG